MGGRITSSNNDPNVVFAIAKLSWSSIDHTVYEVKSHDLNSINAEIVSLAIIGVLTDFSTNELLSDSQF